MIPIVGGRSLGAALAALALVGVVVPGCSSSSGTPVGTVADAGFRPDQNGFPFQNYGDVLTSGDLPTNLTPHDVQVMFGDGVCADAESRKCDLIPEAQAWLDETNQEMAGGHCYGFSVLAELLWQRKLNVKTLGATLTAGLELDDNQSLQRQLAYDWALQLLDSVQSKRINGTPNKILGVLEKELKPNPGETYTIAFWKSNWTGGHAVTPYAVQNEGHGQFKVLIYDNNWPGQSRAISFNTKTNSWSYNAAINPNEPDSLYQGDAETQTISLFPTSPGLGRQPCPFCGKVPTKPSAPNQPGGNNEEIYLLGGNTNHTNLVITDDAGRRLGYINGTLVSEIPGGHADELASNQDWTESQTPDFFVPADARYTITIDGTALTRPDTETAGIIGPSYDVTIKNIPVHPGDKDTLVAEPDATKLSFTSARPESPIITLGVSDQKADYSFQVGGISDQPGSTVNLSLPAEGGSLTMSNVGAARAPSVNLMMTRYTEQGVQTFDHEGIKLSGNDSAELRFGSWTSTAESIPLVVTHDGQQSTQTLSNEQSPRAK